MLEVRNIQKRVEPSGGQTLDEFLDDFPTVSKDAAIGALEMAKKAG